MKELLLSKYLYRATLRTDTDFIAPKKYEKPKFEITYTEIKKNMNNQEQKFKWEQDVHRKGEISVFTDGSHIVASKRNGSGIYCEELDIDKAYQIPWTCDIIQAEVFAVLKAAELLFEKLPTIPQIYSVITIYTDSKQILKHIESEILYSKLQLKCKESLGNLHDLCKSFKKTLRLAYVPAHVGIEGNKKADSLAHGNSKIIEQCNDVGICPSIKVCEFLIGNKCRYCDKQVNIDGFEIHMAECDEIKNMKTFIKFPSKAISNEISSVYNFLNYINVSRYFRKFV